MRRATVEKIIQMARLKTDTEESGFVSDEELLMQINHIRRSLYAQIITKTQSPQFLTEVKLQNSGDGVFELPDDFFQIKSLQASFGGVLIHLEPKSLTEISEPYDSVYSAYTTNTACYVLLGGDINVFPKGFTQELRLIYNAIPEDLELDLGEDGVIYNNSIKLLYHEDRYLIAALSEYIMQKEESDYTPYTQERFEVMGEIYQTYKPSNEFPKKVINTRSRI